MPTPRRLKPTPAERAMFKAVVAGAKAAGLRTPKIRWEVWDRVSMGKGRGDAHGVCVAGRGVIRVDRGSLESRGMELLAHEYAHALTDLLVVEAAADHNRFWSLCYGLLYQQVVAK